jgi:hypothetical protein
MASLKKHLFVATSKAINASMHGAALKFAKRFLIAICLVYLLPALASAGLWAMRERPSSWREANWSSSGMLPDAAASNDAAIYVFSAMTGGLKGALASHAWIVTKARGASSYDRYDKVGWGQPVRRNNYPPDAFWYSNTPRLVVAIHGQQAEILMPQVEQAIASYPYSRPGGYRIYPGPNSNTFVAHVLRSVPELGAVLPPDAVGRDYLPNGAVVAIDDDWRDIHLSAGGYFGLSAGLRSGFEINFLGLVAGIDIRNPGIKIPALGRFGFSGNNNI